MIISELYTRILLSFFFLIGPFNALFCQSTPANSLLSKILPPTATIEGQISSFVTGQEGFGELIFVYGSLTFPMLKVDNIFTFETDIPGPQKLEIFNKSDYLNGVNVGDILKIQNHILTKTMFDKGNKLIAADVNMDGKISVADIIEIRKLILGKIDAFNSKISNTFIDNRFPLFTNNWFLAPHYIIVTPGDTATIHFKTIKMGDVDLNVKGNFNSDLTERTLRSLSFKINDKSFTQGEELRIPVYSSDYKKMRGFQFTIDYNTSMLDFIGVESGAMKIGHDNYNDMPAGGKVNVLYYAEEAENYRAEEELFYLKFNVLQEGRNSECIKFNASITTAAAYDDHMEKYSISFNTAGENINLSQNFPNPFTESTSINFISENNEIVNFRIFDLAGLELYRSSYVTKKGTNQIIVNKNLIENRKGLFFYEIENGKYTTVKKMISL